MTDTLEDRIAELEAENERLREGTIGLFEEYMTVSEMVGMWGDAARLARASLAAQRAAHDHLAKGSKLYAEAQLFATASRHMNAKTLDADGGEK